MPYGPANPDQHLIGRTHPWIRQRPRNTVGSRAEYGAAADPVQIPGVGEASPGIWIPGSPSVRLGQEES